MTALRMERIAELLEPYGGNSLQPDSLEKISRYLGVFQHWSTRVNLTAVRDPEQVVQRHFGEGLVLAAALPRCESLLDLGSGAGFPGFPVALARPEVGVTLAESQKKKAAFLKEAGWMMGSPVSVWPGRAEDLPVGSSFDVVALRAVDDMSNALQTAMTLLKAGGTLAFFAGEKDAIRLPQADWARIESVDLPRSPGHIVVAQLV